MSLKTLTERFEEVNKIKENNPKIDKAVFNIEDVGELLYLYNKEKEENENLTLEVLDIHKSKISKDKIKEKIEEVQARMGNDCIALHDFQREAKIDVLKELLEEI